MTTPPAILVENVFHAFNSHQALDGVSLTVTTGSVHGFVGPNGAGKTTTLKMICTLLKPQTGKVEVFGMDVLPHAKEIRKRIGYMPDHFSMYKQMTVFEYLDFFAAAYGYSLKDRDRIVADVLALTDMEGRKDDLIQGLSRGMQQRVSLSRVLVNDPDLLLLDEPASGLDPRARIELMDILRELRRMGKTILISSHILSELAEVCDGVTIMDRGKTRYSGKMEELLEIRGDQPVYRVKIESRPDSTVNYQELLSGLNGLVKIDPVEGQLEYRLTLDPQVTDRNQLLRFLLDNDVPIAQFGKDQRHLNDAFLDLTERGVRS